MNKTHLSFFAAVGLLCACGGSSDLPDIPLVFPGQDPEDPDQPTVVALDPYKVDCKKTVTTASWTTYDAYTVNCIQGFTPSADPETDKYGGWTIMNLGNADGYFRVQKAAGRWWLVDPDGNIFLSKAVAVFSPGSSDRQKANITEKFGSEYNWAKAETSFLREYGFNSLGAWSSVNTVKGIPEPMPYTVILSPMGSYNGYLKSS